MKKLFRVCVFSVLLCFGPSVTFAQQKPVSFDFRAIAVSEIVQLIYQTAIKTPFVLDPDLLSDTRPVSFRYSSADGDLQVFMQSFLRTLGYLVEKRGGVYYVRKMQPQDMERPAAEFFIYHPQFRSVEYLSKTLAPLLQGHFVGGDASSVNAPVSPAEGRSNASGDVLVFSGSDRDIDQLQKLLVKVDVAPGQVEVHGHVWEVSDTDKKGSAFGLLASLLSGKLNIGIGTAVSAAGNFLQIKAGGLDAVYSMLSQDSRFKVVSSPTLRVNSGESGTFSVGQDVPVLSSLSFPQGGGHAVQSVEYRSSGVIFDVTPQVRGGAIDLRINQQLSNFTQTTTGVNGSPTLMKRQIKTNVSLQDGEIIVLGGLSEDKQTNTRDGLSFLPSFFHTKGNETHKSDILLILQVKKLTNQSLRDV